MTRENVSTPKVQFKTFGCRSNYADTVDLVASVSSEGALVSDFKADAPGDVVVINSCTVTDAAEQEAIKMLTQLREENPETKVVLTGCLAEAKTEELRARFKGVSVIGPGQKDAVLSSILNSATDNGERVRVKPARSGLRTPTHKTININVPQPQGLAAPGQLVGDVRMRSRFHLRVQEGCENHCTFCIIPQTRGLLSSRPKEMVLSDILNLTNLGYREIVLTGTHLGGYGEDFNEEYSLLDLLKYLETELSTRDLKEKLPRIRLSSLDPNDISRDLVDFLSKSNIYCEHLHICLQAFTEVILKRMNRKYTLDEAISLIEYVHSSYPECTIGSDVIVGFPGESRKEVEAGLETFLSLPLSYLHVFPYSEREDTAATRLDGVIHYSERKRRAARWRAEAERKKRHFLEGLDGAEIEVVLEVKQKSDGTFEVRGTSREYAQVRFGDCFVDQSSEEARCCLRDTEGHVHVLPPGSLARAQVIGIDQQNNLLCDLVA